MNFSERLKLYRELNELSQQDLANTLGVTKQNISGWETDKYSPPLSSIYNIADKMGVSVNWLLGTEEKNDIDYSKYGLYPVEKHKIPLLGSVAAGVPIFAAEDLETYLDPSEVNADFALRVKGDSMVGDGILDGDIIFVRKQNMVEQGEVAVVLIEDEATLKHVYSSGQEIQLVASNPAYPPIIIREADAKVVTILGKMVGFYRITEKRRS